MASDLKDLKAWCKTHRQRFIEEKYTVDEIALLAIACGFSRISVATWQSEALLGRGI